MNPYRQKESLTILPKNKKRPFFKTLWLNLLIKTNGKWKDRFVRCQYCKKKVYKISIWDADFEIHSLFCSIIQKKKRILLTKPQFIYIKIRKISK